MPAEQTSHPRQNLILGALRVEEFARIESGLEAVSLTAGQVLYEPGSVISDIYFPAGSLLSLLSITSDGTSVELAMTGHQGMTGIPLVLGSETSPYRVVVQVAGSAYRLHGEVLRWELQQGAGLQGLALRYAQALIAQIAQTAVCNRYHSVEQQLCRCLLFSRDHLASNSLAMTQAAIAGRLGVRREAVTEAAVRLQNAGLIQYSRGNISLLDLAALEARSCECYRTVRDALDSLSDAAPASKASHPLRPNPASSHVQALQRLQSNPPPSISGLSSMGRLLHELQVHQIELEMQNEQLMESYAEADSLRLRYADIYDFSPVAYISIDAVGAIRQINLAGAILLGIKGSDAMRHRFGASVAAADLPRFDRFLHDVLAGRTRKTLELTLTPTGQRGPAVVQITAIPDEGGHECRMVVSDITERHQAVEELAASEARYRQLIDSLPISLVIAQDGLICLANSRALELFGYGPQEAIGRSFLSMIVAEDQAKVMDAHQRRMAGDDAPLSYEVRLLHRDGTRIDCRIYARTIDWQGRRASLGIFDDITERKRMEQELRNLATTDVLTGLPNRRQFITRLEEELARVQRNPGHDAMVLMLDLDHFKLINDSLGHAAGDQVLREFSAILLNELRKVDSAGRIGGEEFAVLLPDTDMEAARIFADRLRHKVEAEAHAGLYPTCPTHPITVSIGIAAMKSADTSVDASLVRADEALYRAKEAGRNRTDVSR